MLKKVRVDKAVKVNTVLVPRWAYRSLHSMTTSAVPTTYNIIPEARCIGKIDVHRDDKLLWWVCQGEDGRIEVLTREGEVVMTIHGDKVDIMGIEAGPYDVIDTVGAPYWPLRVIQVRDAAARHLAWLYTLLL